MPSFNPPSPFRARGTATTIDGEDVVVEFQSALALSGEGNDCSSLWGDCSNLRVSIRPRPFGRGEPQSDGLQMLRENCFNPPSPFRARGTEIARLVKEVLQSFNPPSPFRARGTANCSRERKQPEMFQSALALSGEGNVRSNVGRSAAIGFQSALALSGEGNRTGLDSDEFPPLVSIRPRPFGRGEQGRQLRLNRAHDVSIRPRPFGRGERAAGQRLEEAAWIVSIRPRPFGRGERQAPCGRP